MKQSESVVIFTKAILGNTFRVGVDIWSYITDPQIEEVVDGVTQSIKDGETDLSADARVKFADPKALRRYVKGMVGNHFNKHKELNGNTKYVAKNPGSRAGSGDSELSASKALLAKLVAEGKDTAIVEEFIAKRTAEIAEKKVKAVDVSKLPEHLRNLA